MTKSAKGTVENLSKNVRQKAGLNRFRRVGGHPRSPDSL
jgi:hypothetical protein